MSGIERGNKPWSPDTVGGVILDGVTLGVARIIRAKRVRAEMARMDDFREQRPEGRLHTMTPEPLPNLKPDATIEQIARDAYTIAKTAKLICIETLQGYKATSWRNTDGTRSVDSHFVGRMHGPTLQRVKVATGRDYIEEVRNGHDVIALRERAGMYTNVEGIGCIAREYPDPDSTSSTGRFSDATFLIQGIAPYTAERFTDALQKYPAEMLDGIAYIAFTGAKIPGHSMLQMQPTDEQTESLFVPGLGGEVTIAAAPRL